ncbi:hypothetical protein ABZU32_39870 [Sphaerisporangium sp. NPDC005288]|uniref:hypothetical protein n=1 Tax=Sphaerisporangium sp. NPDC005288 TaxID=3155114 RepID=UPI0033BA7C90
MAVPPIQAAGLATVGRVNRLPLALDVLVGLLIAVALPLAIVAVPNTISVVASLLPPGLAGVWILRAHGLALPAMLCAVPLAGSALRRVNAATMLLVGFACLAVADVAGGFADSTFAVGALRVLHGIGAGVLLPATFAASSERRGASRDVLMPLWAGMLAVSMLAAQALALWPLDAVTSWRVTLQPYPLLTGVALALAAVHSVLWRATGDTAPSARPSARGRADGGAERARANGGGLRSHPGERRGGVHPEVARGVDAAAGTGAVGGDIAVPVADPADLGPEGRARSGPRGRVRLGPESPASLGPEGRVGPESRARLGLEGRVGPEGRARSGAGGRAHLGPAAGLSAGIAVLAFGTTFDWPSGLILVAATIAVVMLLAVAGLSRVEGPGGRLVAFVMVAVGLVVLPTAAQVTYVELGGLGGPGLSGLWAAFGLAAVVTLVAASLAGRAGLGAVPKLVGGGLVAMVVGLCAVRLFVPSASGMPLVVPFSLLSAGAAVAVTSAIRAAGHRASLFGLSLCFPAVLCGFLLGTGIQVGRLRAVSTSGKVTTEAMVDGFVGALHIWALVAGFTVVIVLVLGAALARRAYEGESSGRSGRALEARSPGSGGALETRSPESGRGDGTRPPDSGGTVGVPPSPRRSASKASDVKVAPRWQSRTAPFPAADLPSTDVPSAGPGAPSRGSDAASRGRPDADSRGPDVSSAGASAPPPGRAPSATGSTVPRPGWSPSAAGSSAPPVTPPGHPATGAGRGAADAAAGPPHAEADAGSEGPTDGDTAVLPAVPPPGSGGDTAELPAVLPPASCPEETPGPDGLAR